MKARDIGRLFGLDVQIGKIGTISRNYDLVFGELFGSGQLDADLFLFLGFDGYQFFSAVVMQTHPLNGEIIFPGGKPGNVDPIGILGCEHLVNDAGAGAVKPIENDQDRILMLVGSCDVVELEPDGSCIDQGFRLDIGASGSHAGPGVRLHCSAEEQAKGVGD